MEPILALAIQETPLIVAAFKDIFKRQNPDAPVPTDEDVFKAYKQAFESSLAKDDNWLALHPQ